MLLEEFSDEGKPRYRTQTTTVASADGHQEAGIVSMDTSILPATTGAAPAPTLAEKMLGVGPELA